MCVRGNAVQVQFKTAHMIIAILSLLLALDNFLLLVFSLGQLDKFLCVQIVLLMMVSSEILQFSCLALSTQGHHDASQVIYRKDMLAGRSADFIGWLSVKFLTARHPLPRGKAVLFCDIDYQVFQDFYDGNGIYLINFNFQCYAHQTNILNV